MIFQKPSAKIALENNEEQYEETLSPVYDTHDEVETVVGPSVNVEGDFASEGNITVKGSVAGSVHTSKHLSVEEGARILANVRAGSARVAGEVKGNMKVKDSLELTSTARILGDIEVKTLVVAAGALIFGKIAMPGLEGADIKNTSKRNYGRKASNDTTSPEDTVS